MLGWERAAGSCKVLPNLTDWVIRELLIAVLRVVCNYKILQ